MGDPARLAAEIQPRDGGLGKGGRLGLEQPHPGRRAGEVLARVEFIGRNRAIVGRQ